MPHQVSDPKVEGDAQGRGFLQRFGVHRGSGRSVSPCKLAGNWELSWDRHWNVGDCFGWFSGDGSEW